MKKITKNILGLSIFLGILSTGFSIDAAIESRVASSNDYTKVLSSGWEHSCAILDDGNSSPIYCWGNNDAGQLGGHYPMADDSVNFTAVDAGAFHTCAVADNNDVYCWGNNHYGQKTRPPSTPRNRYSVMPAKITLPDGTTPMKAKSVTAGRSHTCAILLDDTIHCWGDIIGSKRDGLVIHPLSENGTGAYPSSLRGVNVKSLTAARDYTCAVLEDGGVSCWGNLGDGPLGHHYDNNFIGGDGSSALIYSQTRKYRIEIDKWGFSKPVASVSANDNHLCVTYGGPLVAAVMGYRIRCYALGQFLVYANGDGKNGNPGLSSRRGRVQSVSTGRRHSCAVLPDGGLQCWGRNFSGETGSSITDTTLKTFPRINIVFKALAVSAGDEFSCAVLEHRGVLCWGKRHDTKVSHVRWRPLSRKEMQ